MNHELETLIELRELLLESPSDGHDTMLAAYLRACERYSMSNAIPMATVMNFVRKMHARKLASENKRSGRPPNP